MSTRIGSVFRWAGLAGLALVVALTIAWFAMGGASGIASSRLPEFPDWPGPSQSLDQGGEGDLYFATASPYDFDLLLGAESLPVPTIGTGHLILPDGLAPEVRVPAVILVHGSGGISPGREMRVAQGLADAGYAAFVLDYYRPRGVTPETDYMSKVLAVTEFDAATDAYSALELLSTHPSIDPKRIGVMGFSYGGMAVRIAMDERVRQRLAPDHPGFAAFVDTYGPCFQNFGTSRVNGAPLLTLRGTLDASNDLEACEAREDELRALGVDVDARVYEGAGHAWESDTPRRLFEDSPYVAGCTIRYDEKGHSFIGGTPIVDGALDDTRADRVVLRLASGGPMRDCVGSGYVIGRDDETRARATAAYMDFFARVLGAPAVAG